MERLFMRIQREAPNAERQRMAIRLGVGRLEVSMAGKDGFRDKPLLPANAFSRSKWDVVTFEEIAVHQQRPEYAWSASLWYGRLPDTNSYRWYETSYFSPHRSENQAPYSLARRIEDADLAAAPIMHVYGIAFGPTAIDDENEEDFFERWSALLAMAAQGKLNYPSYLPLRPQFWRQHFVV
jgi:hypothetical protein